MRFYLGFLIPVHLCYSLKSAFHSLVLNILNNALSILKINLLPTSNFIILLAIVLVITVTLSSLTFKFIEVLGMAIGRNLIKKYKDLGEK